PAVMPRAPMLVPEEIHGPRAHQARRRRRRPRFRSAPRRRRTRQPVRAARRPGAAVVLSGGQHHAVHHPGLRPAGQPPAVPRFRIPRDRRLPGSGARAGPLRGEQNLPYDLASDESHEVMSAYGAWGEKNMYGRIVQGTIRSTFAIDPDRRLSFVKYRVGTPKHIALLQEKLSL